MKKIVSTLCSMILIYWVPTAHAQFSGSFGGTQGAGVQQSALPEFNPMIQQYIQVDATVETRVEPDQVRIVLAVTHDGKTPAECKEAVFSKIDQLRSALVSSGLKKEDIVDDFIASLPRYEFKPEDRGGRKYSVEFKSGYSMQSNLHIKAENDAAAMKVLQMAFDLGISDIIGVDYGSSTLDAAKTDALKQAISKAQEKSELLLSVFEKRPEPINIQSATEVVQPSANYVSFDNSNSETYRYGKKDLPEIRAFRPKNTFYKGYFNPQADVQPNDVAMKSEITLVSKVSLFYASPVAKEYRALEAKAK